LADRITKLKSMPGLSDNLIQVLLKMLVTNDKQRPTMHELEQHLVQVVDTPGSGYSRCHSEAKHPQNNKELNEMVAAEPNRTDEPNVGSNVNMPAQPLLA
jgi:hypothetical protein